MTSIDRPTNAAFLCCNFARNFAYHSIFRRLPHLDKLGFWLTVYGNFVDACVLEWCKLFGNRNGMYHWRKVFSDPEAFRRKLLDTHGIDEDSLDKLWSEVKNYRDDFVAHSERQTSTTIPNMNVPHLLVGFYFGQLQQEFPAIQADSIIPTHFDRYYDACLKEAEAELLHAKKART